MQQIEALANDTAQMAETWLSAVDTFNATVQTFSDFIDDAIQYKPLVDAIYIGFDQVNVSNEIFNGAFYDDLDVTTLEAKQSYAIQFLRESSLDYESVKNMFRARVVFYSLVNNEYAKEEPVADMLNTVTLAMTFGAAETEVGHTRSSRERGRTHS